MAEFTGKYLGWRILHQDGYVGTIKREGDKYRIHYEGKIDPGKACQSSGALTEQEMNIEFMKYPLKLSRIEPVILSYLDFFSKKD